MWFLIVLGVIGLAGIGAAVRAVLTDGYGPVRTRDSESLRRDFDHVAFHAAALPAEYALPPTGPTIAEALAPQPAHDSQLLPPTSAAVEARTQTDERAA